jgi:hypothetical protein
MAATRIGVGIEQQLSPRPFPLIVSAIACAVLSFIAVVVVWAGAVAVWSVAGEIERKMKGN